MTIKFSPAITNSSTYSLMTRVRSTAGIFGGTLYIYPTTVPFPSSCPTSITAGRLASFSLSTSIDANGVLEISSYPSANTVVGTGQIGWWHFFGSSTAGTASDSVSLPGGSGILWLDTLNVTAGQQLNVLSFNMRFSST